MCAQVSGKLIDKEQTLEEEIQLRERIDLQRKQAERTVDDLKMELHTANQAKEDLAKQVKQAQVRLLVPPAGAGRRHRRSIAETLSSQVSVSELGVGISLAR